VYLIVIFIALIYSDPGILVANKLITLLSLVENHENIIDYCPICIVSIINNNK